MITHIFYAISSPRKPQVYETSMKKLVISIIHGANPNIYDKNARYVQVV
jgi:hypothetical protein